MARRGSPQRASHNAKFAKFLGYFYVHQHFLSLDILLFPSVGFPTLPFHFHFTPALLQGGEQETQLTDRTRSTA